MYEIHTLEIQIQATSAIINYHRFKSAELCALCMVYEYQIIISAVKLVIIQVLTTTSVIIQSTNASLCECSMSLLCHKNIGIVAN